MHELRLKNLKEIAKALDAQIDVLETTGKSDDKQMADLQKQRLQCEDNIAVLESWKQQHTKL